jgi:magnesium chelatase family protein
VQKARLLQRERYASKSGVHCNAQMSRNELDSHCRIDENGNTILKNAMDRLGLSARAYDRIIKVARTIADLDHSESIDVRHLAEAIQYRTLDKEGWAG